MQFIDTHIHLQDYKSKNATDIVRQAVDEGCRKLVCVSAVEEDWAKVAELAELFPDIVIPAFGLHPWYAVAAGAEWRERLSGYLRRFPQALIGECGLDRLKSPEPEPQKAVFTAQIGLAKEFKRPLIIHAVRAAAWLEEYWPCLPDKFVFHSFNGKPELLQKIVSCGGYVGLSASVLRNPRLPELLRQIPMDKLLVETDGPSQSLFLGEEGMPWFLPEQLKRLAAAAGEEPSVLAAGVYKNSEEFIRC